jgi:hypothetical protein
VSKGVGSTSFVCDFAAMIRSHARELSSSVEFVAVARNSAESDICRAIIDLDRCLYLLEREFSVNYQGELFVAQRK